MSQSSNHTVLPFLLALLVILAGNRTCAMGLQGWGRVSLQGAILESACAIDTQSLDQSIEMAILPVSQVIRDGGGTLQPFYIRLINCRLTHLDPSLPDWSTFQITFDGLGEEGLFGVEGQAKGVALQITDDNGHIARPGEPMPAGRLTGENMQLQYALQLVANYNSLRAGNYTSAIRFKMEYY